MGDRLVTIDIGRKEGEAAVPLLRAELGPHLTQCDLGWGLPPYQVASWSIQPFGHNRHGPKIWGGGCAPLGDPGPHLTICRLGQGLHRYQVASWSIQPFCHNRHGPKIGEGRLCSIGGLGSPSNTMWPGLRSTSVPSGVVIHPAIWPQQTWA